jgi:hypothetical protein
VELRQGCLCASHGLPAQPPPLLTSETSSPSGIDDPDGAGGRLARPETGDPNQSAHSSHLTNRRTDVRATVVSERRRRQGGGAVDEAGRLLRPRPQRARQGGYEPVRTMNTRLLRVIAAEERRRKRDARRESTVSKRNSGRRQQIKGIAAAPPAPTSARAVTTHEGPT